MHLARVVGPVLFGLFAILMAGCSDGSVGTKEAERDISVGILKIKTYGMQGDADKEYAALLKDRCSVTVEYKPGKVSSDEEKQIGSYNKRMEQEIKKKYGDDILDKLHQEALVKMAAKSPPEKK